MSNITTQELDMIENVRTPEQWDAACDTVKANRGGRYPDDWWPRVKLTGLMDKVMARYGETSELKVTRL